MAPVKPTKTAKKKTAKNKTAKKSRKTKAKSNNKKESKNKTKKPTTTQTAIVLVYADWCTHCNAMKPDWNNMKNRLGANMDTIEIEDSDFDKDQKIRDIEEHKLNGEHLDILGYPTMFKIHNGHVDYYGGSRTLDAMTEWATTTKGGYIKSKLKATNRSIRHKSPR